MKKERNNQLQWNIHLAKQARARHAKNKLAKQTRKMQRAK